MGFCSSTCNNDIMNNKKVVAEVRELLVHLVDIFNKMDMANEGESSVTKAKDIQDEASVTRPREIESPKAIEKIGLPATLTRATAKQFIQNVDAPLVLALKHSNLSMVKYMCMLTHMYGIRGTYRRTETCLLSQRIIDAIVHQDLPSLRYFHSWLSDFEGFALNESSLIELAFCCTPMWASSSTCVTKWASTFTRS